MKITRVLSILSGRQNQGAPPSRIRSQDLLAVYAGDTHHFHPGCRPSALKQLLEQQTTSSQLWRDRIGEELEF